MEKLLDDAICEYSTGSNFSEIKKFVEFVKYKLEIFPHVVALIILKIKSSTLVTRLHCMNVLDTCMEQCGHPFVCLVAKNTTLNEFIKMIHPQYDKEKYELEFQKKIVQTVCEWSRKYYRYPKIVQFYEKLVNCDFIDKTYFQSDKIVEPWNTIGDDFSNYRLNSLLKTPTPENIEAANKIIRGMVKNEEKQLQKTLEYYESLECVNEHCKIINEIVQNNNSISEDDSALLKELSLKCEEHLVKLQSECDKLASQNDPMLEKIIDLTCYISDTLQKYETFRGNKPSITNTKQTNNLLISFDEPSIIYSNQFTQPINENLSSNVLSDLDIFTSNIPIQNNIKTESHQQKPQSSNSQTSFNLLDDIFQ